MELTRILLAAYKSASVLVIKRTAPLDAWWGGKSGALTRP
jgi:hypothetical protein